MAVLTVTIKEEVTLNGSLRTFENVHTETVDDLFHRIYEVGAPVSSRIFPVGWLRCNGIPYTVYISDGTYSQITAERDDGTDLTFTDVGSNTINCVLHYVPQ